MTSAFFSPTRLLPGRLGPVLFLWAAGPLLAGAARPAPTPAAPLPPPAPVVTGPAYFFNIDLDPRYQFTGTGQLTGEEAQRSNCYRFVYNKDGKLEQVAYRGAGMPRRDPAFGAASIDIEYPPGIERRWFRNAHSEGVKNDNGVYGEELTLNAAGFPTAVTNLDSSGAHMRDDNGVVQYVRTLDEHNRVVSSRRMGLFGTAITDNSGYFERRWTYDDQGRTVELDNYDDHGELLDDNDGVAIISTAYTIYPDSMLVVESYSDSSRIATEQRSTGVHQVQRTFDKRGFLIDEAYFDSTGAPTTLARPGLDTRVHEFKRTVDDLGNLTSEEYFDINGRPVDERGPEIARITYKYNDRNQVSEESFFGDDGAPQINPGIGAARIQQEYDADGHIVRQLFLDGQGHPCQSARYLAPALRIRVDKDTTTVFLRNEQDQPAKNPINGYSAFSYKTASDHPLSPTNKYFDQRGRRITIIRERIIFPHLHALRGNWGMKWSARLGALAAGLGSLLGCFLALKKSSFTKRRKVYVPPPLERFFGWFSVFAILEGSLRFFMTVYWAWVDYQNGSMGLGFNAIETLFIVFFLYRLYRMTVTMRVLNIEREDVHKLVRDFFAKAGLKPEWVEAHRRYLTPPLDVRVDYFQKKFHAYLAFTRRGPKGVELARDLAAYIRAQTGGILAPVRTRMIALYYPAVAVCYFLLAGMAFYTLFQLVKGYS